MLWDRIASDKRKLDQGVVKAGAFVLNGLSSGFWICLDATNVAIWQRQNYGPNISDVLIGPLNL